MGIRITESLISLILIVNVLFHPDEDNIPAYLATPIEGYDLGLPHDHPTELPISAFQGWD